MKQPHWPDRWDFRKGAIYYRPRASERHKEPFKSKGKYYFRLGATESEAFEKWAEIHQRFKPRTIREGIGRYKASKAWAKLGDKTRKGYSASLERVDEVFGHMPPGDVLPSDISDWLETRPDVAGNRDKAALSNVMGECIRAGVLRHNPCREVKRAEEESRDRYIEDDELTAFLDYCGDAELKARLLVLWCTGARPGQLRVLPLKAWDGEGLSVDKAKRGRKIRYSGPVLKTTIEAMLTERKGKRAQSDLLFPNRSGKMYTDDGWRCLFQKHMKAWGEAGNERFQERDIRAKVAVDSDGVIDANERLGHQSLSTTKRVYRRGTVQVSVLGSTALENNVLPMTLKENCK